MGVSEVLLCPYRCLEYKMERYKITIFSFTLSTQFLSTVRLRQQCSVIRTKTHSPCKSFQLSYIGTLLLCSNIT